jgi:hypothetical protein
MKQVSKTTRLALSLASVLCLAIVSTNAQANIFKAISKGISGGIDTVGSGLQEGIKQGSNLAKDMASKAVDGGRSVVGSAMRASIDLGDDMKHLAVDPVATSYARAQQQVDLASAELARSTAAYQQALMKQGAAISSTEMRNIVNQAKNVYADSTTAMTNGYNAAVAKFQALLDAALDAIYRAAGKAFVNKSGKFILDMKHRAENLDANSKAALNRVKRAIGSKIVDVQANEDMQTLVKAIVYGGNDIGSAVTRSSFGIQFCDISVGVGAAGGEACYMMIMQTYLEDGKFKVGLARSFGVAASPVPSVVGAEHTFGIFWGPGGINDNNGASIGLALGVVLEAGLEVGVSWSIPTAIPDPSNLIPGFSISVGAGAKGEAALTAGYTQVLAKI